MIHYTPSDIEGRLLARRIETPTGCWEYGGYRNPAGYGILRINQTRHRAHRAMWVAVWGPIPDGLIVCHSCDNPPCFNPEHLFLGTPKDNTQDMLGKGRSRYVNHQSAQTHCKRGHEFDAENTYVDGKGYRRCRACAHAYQVSRRAG